MWKQKLRICAINLTAYSIALAIIAILSDCLRLYGQENCIQSFGWTYNIVTDMDFVYSYKLSFNEYGKPFLFPYFTGMLPKKSEMMWDFRPNYTLSFPVNRTPLHKR